MTNEFPSMRSSLISEEILIIFLLSKTELRYSYRLMVWKPPKAPKDFFVWTICFLLLFCLFVCVFICLFYYTHWKINPWKQEPPITFWSSCSHRYYNDWAGKALWRPSNASPLLRQVGTAQVELLGYLHSQNLFLVWSLYLTAARFYKKN